MTAPRLISPSTVAKLAETAQRHGAIIEVSPDGTVRIIPQRPDVGDEYDIREIKP